MKKYFTFKKIIMYIVIIFVGLGLFALLPGHTDSIFNEQGKEISGSITTMKKITLNGAKQWIVIRGESRKNPVLLLLSGGPGGTEMGRFLKYNQKLEKDFVVVNWEQRGCGKSYPAIKDNESMSVEQYVADIKSLTEYLKERFQKEKIYLLGHSWGTIIGTKAVQKYPENYYAYIGAAQMVNIDKTDKYIYDFVLKAAKKAGDTKLVNTLKKNGSPPYYGEKVLNKYKPFLSNYRQYYRRNNPYHEKNTEWYNPLKNIFALSEYNLLDKINVVRGMINTFNLVYPQIQDVDFIEQADTLKVPVYYLIGRHDYTARFIKDYVNILDAPSKEVFWFENSGHGEIWSEPEKFHRIMVETILSDTY